jgi:hypothetical protein
MIDRIHALPVTRQCQTLSLARSTAYYRPQEACEADLALMRKMDELHLEYPFAGSRMLRDMLRQDGHAIGRKHVATLMKRMNIEAVYKKPNTSRRHPAHANVFVERLWKSIKYEEVYLRAYETVSAARSGIARYIDFYNSRRPHSSLDAMTPDAFYFKHLPLMQRAA